MTIESDFLELMTQTVTIQKFTANDKYGQPSHDVGTDYTARTVNKTQVIRDTENKEKVSTAVTWIYGSPGITALDKITLPDGSQPVILRVEAYPDENGNHHEKVYT